MNAASFNADDAIIPQIDAGTLRLAGNVVARSLLEKIGFQHEIVSRYDKEGNLPIMGGRDPLWQQINALPPNKQGGLRLVVSLAHKDELDWYTAEFFILWARQEGLSELEIGSAFGLIPDGS